MALKAALADLRSKVGTEIHVGPWLIITQERIDAFAEATGDFQWIHVDPERTRAESPFGTTVAHGYLTLSLIPYLTGSGNNDYPGGHLRQPGYVGVKMGVNYGLNRVRFPHPVTVGARIRARTELIGVEEVTGGLQLVKKVTIEIEGATKPACVAETVSRLYF
jgi:acyl dehydratase